MTAWYRFEHLFTPQGWLSPAWVAVDKDGTIAAVESTAPERDAVAITGHALPGMPNLHSHAFQRAMAGLAERPGGGDSFWTWRDAMYRLVARLTPDDVAAIAAQAYLEMLEAGYTAVAEFHYLHHGPGGTPYADRAEMSRRILAAARATGIGLTHLPVLYAAGSFGGGALDPGQRRFACDAEMLLGMIEDLSNEADGQIHLGLALHSLRAVPEPQLTAALAGPRPIHIHIAEQPREVEDCLAWSGACPVDWLLDHAPVDGNWCLVHATHMTEAETDRLAASGAVAGLCPTTEANLGDGLFPLPRYIERQGAYGIGSDSHISISPVEELRWLEYGQRLATGARNLAGSPAETTGTALYRAALSGGARAMGRRLGAIEPGRRADIVVLDATHAMFAGCTADQVLDAYIFAGNGRPVRDVMVGGQWQVRDGRHLQADRITADYQAARARLTAND